ncbi:MAG: hypothetical protein O2955_12045 [Planctomycetota bacterium]|nr:hypothetical protein [Planctomycetota bacterium]MDA1213243.1 hypothetical protein [Planctomycetota bacterium]
MKTAFSEGDDAQSDARGARDDAHDPSCESPFDPVLQLLIDHWPQLSAGTRRKIIDIAESETNGG